MSCPRLPGKPYVLVADLSGVRPGLALPDGRRVNLNLDPLVFMTLHHLVPGLWNGGPGGLDRRGEARGWLDLTSVPVPPGGFGLPAWIAVAVLDPLARRASPACRTPT